MQSQTDSNSENGASTDRQSIQDYYGRVLSRSADLQTSACCASGGMLPHLAEIAGELAPEVVEKFYGCGSPIPPAIHGCTVLDLGCGTGRDVFLCSKLVGRAGRAVGIDMTAEQLDVAHRHVPWHAKRFGHEVPNTAFLHGYVEDLASVGIRDASVDVVISNCVINLSPDKKRVFSEVLRVLKPGGELLFSDVFADRRLDPALREDPVLVGECLAGAMYWEDFRRMMQGLGVPDVRVVSSNQISVGNGAISTKLGAARFRSVTVRAFKLPSLEDRCEDYGQVAIYRGGIEGSESRFRLDDHHEFEAGRPHLVCGNTAAMLAETRFAEHFGVVGNRNSHFGLFPCGAASAPREASGGGSCC